MVSEETKAKIRITITALIGLFSGALTYNLCVRMNSPLVIILDVLATYETNMFIWVVQFFAMMFLLNIKINGKEVRPAVRRQFYIKSTVFITVIFILLMLLPLPYVYGNVRVNNEKPSKIKYCCLLLADAVSKTDTVKIDSKDFQVETHAYKVKTRSGIEERKVSYGVYEGYSTLLYNDNSLGHVAGYQEEGKDLVIEYYKHSGVIKKIDGVDLYYKRH